jgi:hypothetical protein
MHSNPHQIPGAFLPVCTPLRRVQPWAFAPSPDESAARLDHQKSGCGVASFIIVHAEKGLHILGPTQKHSQG